MSPQSFIYAAFTVIRDAMEVQTKANLEIWKAFESFTATLPKPSFDEMLAFANQTAKAFTPSK